MSLDLFRVIKGIDIQSDDISLSSQILNGDGVPGLTTETNDATVGSVYMQTDNETDNLNLYWKHTAGSGADKWARATSKAYVDAAVAGISWREPVRVIDDTSFADITAAETALNTAAGDIGGLTTGAAGDFAAGDRIIFTNLTTGTENVYIVTGAPTDSGTGATLTEDPTNTLTNGDAVLVLEGDEADSQWVFDGDTTNEWVKFGGASSNTELQNIRDFIGKDGAGVESPDYPSNAIVVDGNSLENEIGRLDHATGDLTFTDNNVISNYSDNLPGAATGTITDALDALDSIVGDGVIAPAGGNYILDGNLENNGGTGPESTITGALDAINEGIGSRDYTNDNIVVDGETITASIDKLDTELGDLNNTSAYTSGGAIDNTTIAGNTVQENLDSFNQLIGDIIDDTDEGTGTNVTTLTPIDSVPATEATELKWILQVKDNATGTARRAMEIHALTDGVNVDWNRSSVLRLGTQSNIGNLGVSVDINAGNVRLIIDPANAVDYTYKRVTKSFL